MERINLGVLQTVPCSIFPDCFWYWFTRVS